MTKRLEFTRKTKLARWAHCKGLCEGKNCGAVLTPPKLEYHHEKEADDGGDNSFSNCRVLCLPCHKVETKRYVRAIRKADRQKSAHLKAKPQPARKLPARPFPVTEKAPKPTTKAMPPRRRLFR